MNIPITDLKTQYESIKEEVHGAIDRVLAQGQYILGPEVKAFEEEMAEYCNVKHAVGVASGTDALHLALRACGIKSGDEVITTPFTFVATVEAIRHCGATPIFVDIDRRIYNIDPSRIESKISSRTKAILPVHLFGQSADMDPILKIAQKYHLKVIEDCAQAIGAEYKGRKVGSIGDVGCLSFFPGKTLGAYGDGGMIITSDLVVAETIRILRKHGASRSYYYEMIGFNSRLDSLQAAVLRVKLKRLGKWIGLRREKAALYNRLISKLGGVTPPFEAGYGHHAFNYYTVRLDPSLDRDALRRYLKENGIGTAIYYPLSLHLQPVYSQLGYQPGDLSQSERAQDEVLSLPMYPELDEEAIEQVVENLAGFIKVSG